MTIRIWNGKWLISGNAIATSADCCCDDTEPDPCFHCYQIAYSWQFPEITNPSVTHSFNGTVLIYDGEIVCYDDPDVVSVEVGVFSGGKLMALDYGTIDGQPCSITLVCDYPSLDGGAVLFDRTGILDVLDLTKPLCCGAANGSYTEANFTFPADPGVSATVDISTAAAGVCDCTGKTAVPP